MGILVAITTGFASGVFLRSLFIFSWQPILFILLLATLFAIPAFLKPRLVYSLGAVFCFCFALGVLRAHSADTPLPHLFVHDLHHKVSYTGIVVIDPDVRDANQHIEVRVTKGEESTKILVTTARGTTVSVGDTVSITGVLTVPEPFADDAGRMFRYDKYLARDGVRFTMRFALVHVTTNAPWYSVSGELAHIKHLFLDGITATLPEPYSSLAGGIVIGGKSGLGTELQNAFVRSGLIQIIVLSGYNVMVVAEWLMAILSLAKVPRTWSAFSGAVAILVFISIAGFSSTAVRAAIMAFIALYAKATGRTYVAGRALLVTVFFMIVWNPFYLVFDPGFGLSVTATAGLIWLSPLFETLLSKMKNLFWRNALATTLAAQVAVLPLLLYATGNLSLVSLPATLLTIPVVPLAMGFSAFAGFAGILFHSFAPLIGIVSAFPAYICTLYIISIAVKAAELPFAAFTLPPFPFFLVLLAYAALIFIASSKRFSTTLQLRLERNASM
jgi:competence protein ComEC